MRVGLIVMVEVCTFKSSVMFFIFGFFKGAGHPISSCPGNSEKNGGLCYPKCKRGYKGLGPVEFNRHFLDGKHFAILFVCCV